MQPVRGLMTLVLLSTVTAGATSERPSTGVPPQTTDRVRVSSSGHYFTYRGKTRLLLCDSGTQCVLQNLNVDYRAWVKQCAAEGHPGVHIWAFVAPRQQLDGSRLEGRWGYLYPGATPWRRKTAGPKADDGGYQWDLTAFDEGDNPDEHYWPRLRDLCLQLKKREMVLGITVFFGWPKDIPGDLHYHPFFHLNGGPARTRQDISRIAKPGTEVHMREWSDDWPTQMKTQWLWERFCLKLIKETRPFGNVWFDFRDEWSYDNKTNLEEHFRRSFMKRGQLWADRSRAADFRVSNPGVPAWGTTPAMKTEGGPYDHKGVREEVWRRATGGVHYMLHNDNRSPGIMAWDPKTAKLKRLDFRKDLGRKYVGIAARLFNQHIARLDEMAPANGLVDGKATCLAAPGREYVIYVPSGRTVTVDLSSAEVLLSARWYDPRTGRFSKPTTVKGGTRRSFEAPDRQDWVLHVARPVAGGEKDDR
jgi:hypothetical protein